MINATAFKTTAGNTTAAKSTPKAASPGKPTNTSAIDRKVTPERSVPKQTNTVPTATFCAACRNKTTTTKRLCL